MFQKYIKPERDLIYNIVLRMGASCCVMVINLDKQTFTSEFEIH